MYMYLYIQCVYVDSEGDFGTNHAKKSVNNGTCVKCILYPVCHVYWYTNVKLKVQLLYRFIVPGTCKYIVVQRLRLY